MGSLAIHEKKGALRMIEELVSVAELKREVERECNMHNLYLPVHFFDIVDGMHKYETEAEIEGSGHEWFFVCGECHTTLKPHANYCHECGRKVKWT